MKHLPLLVFAASFAAIVSLSAQQDAPVVNTDAILRELNLIEQQQKQILTSSKTAALNKLRSAAASGSAAVSLYEDAFIDTEFEGKPNKGSLVSDWRDASADFLRSRELQTIVMLHLKYLALSLERANSEDTAAFAAPSLAYAQELAAADAALASQAQRSEQIKNDKQASARDREHQAIFQKNLTFSKELLQKSINDSIFTKWMRLAPWLPGKGISWEGIPGNLSGILEKNVRGTLRDQKSPQLVQTWDFEMKYLADRATAGRSAYQAADFNTSAGPVLVFARANDYILLGQKNRGIGDIYNLVKTYPQHPDFNKWIARLREVLPKKPIEPEPAAPAAAPTAPAGTSPQ